MESKKVLLGRDNIEGYIDRQKNSILIDGAMIIPPGMKDFLQTEGISIVYKKEGELPETVAPTVETREETVPEAEDRSYQELTARITSILAEKHQVTDEETLQRLCLNVVKEINK